MPATSLSLRFAFVSVVCGLVACGGGSGSAQPAAAPTPAPGQPPAPAPTPVAITDLSAGQWLELPNTKIRSVLPSPLPDGDASNLIKAWSGGTVDSVRGRLLVWGGGHGDYSGNEMYALDLARLAVQRIVEPSPFTGQSNCSAALPDGTPTSRHTYDALAYVAHADKLFATGGSLAPCGASDLSTWTYDFTALKWTRNVAVSPMSTQFGTMAVYDASSRLVYVKDQAAFYTYAADTNTYSKLADNLAVDYHLSAAIDTKRRKFVMIGNGVQVIDLATNRLTTMATSNAPPLTGAGQSPGIGYDPIADRIVAWSGGSSVYALDMDSGAWTQVATNAGPPAAAPAQGTFGRWGYVPQHRVFALVNDIDQNAWVFRLAK